MSQLDALLAAVATAAFGVGYIAGRTGAWPLLVAVPAAAALFVVLRELARRRNP